MLKDHSQLQLSLSPYQGLYDAIIPEDHLLHFTGLSGRHSVLERPLYEVNGRPFFSQKTTA